MKDNEEYRKDFIKEMYSVYWSNMARSMDGIWRVLAPITVTGTIIAGVHKDILPAQLGIAVAIMIIFWALNVTIDLNAWHRRNLFFATKSEQEFLSIEDYGVLLPGKYRLPKFGWITFYIINAFSFAAILIFIIVYAITSKLRYICFIDGFLSPLIVFILGIALTVYNAMKQERSSKDHYNELFKKGNN